jgi:hypothetical protein
MRPFERFLLGKLLLPESLAAYQQAVMLRPIPTLYHYTSMTGLRGILSSRTIWATDYRCLNDMSEVIYADAIIRETVHEETTDLSQPIQDFLRRFSYIVQYASSRMHMHIHIASFCQEGDSLCQWREYARQGVAIGLFGAPLEDLPDCHIVKVEYRRDVQKQFIREAFRLHVASIKQAFDRGDKDEIRAACDPFATQLMFYAAAFKHPAFADEREWRAITGATEPNIQTRTSGDLVQRYVTLSLELQLGGGIALSEVLLSPFLDVTIAQPEVEAVLAEQGFTSELICRSTAPLRAIGGA